jgi:hypothetical protein
MSSNSGVEFLMNNGNISKGSINDLNDLEFELNELNDITNDITLNDSPRNTIDIGKETLFESFNMNDEINLNYAEEMDQQGLKKEDILKRKFEILKKLEQLERKKGVELTKKYSIDSSLVEMEMEYKIHEDHKKKQSSVMFYGTMLKNLIQGIEYLNTQFDPAGIDLDGLTDKIEEDIDEFDDVFEELHEKYKDKGKIIPELKLLFQVGGAAAMVAITNKLMKSSIPGAETIFRENPDLAAQFKDAAMKSMGNQMGNGFGNFMNSMSGTQSFPPPLNTQEEDPEKYMNRGGNNFVQENETMSKSAYLPRQQPMPSNQTLTQTQNRMRPDMNGPKDISDLLSGLKTKTITIPEKKTKISPTSTVMSDDKPKKSKRKPSGSRNNTISLDL